MKTIIALFITALAGYVLPAKGIVPVQDATEHSWNAYSYWSYPWGKSGVHKGIDIFAPKGALALASTAGIVIYSGHLQQGGNVIAILGPKWRIQYYAHLEGQTTHFLHWVSKGQQIGYVGDSGNAKGKPSHLHYSVLRLIPDFTDFTMEPQGWKRMFYMNPAHTFKLS